MVVHDTDFWSKDHQFGDCSEAEVRDKFIDSFLTALGWSPTDWSSELSVDMQLGSASHLGKIDVLICDTAHIVHKDGKRYAPLKDSHVVIEFKKPGSVWEFTKAKKQALSYAHSINAHLYLVIDGKNIELRETWKPITSAALVEGAMNNLSVIRPKFEHWLGKSSRVLIRDFINASSDAETSNLTSAINDLRQLRGWRNIVISCSNRDKTNWTGPLLLEHIREFWGHEQNPETVRQNSILFDSALKDTPDGIAECLLRLGIHGGIKEMYVPDSDQWIKATQIFTKNTLGKFQSNKEWQPQPHRNAHGWAILPSQSWPSLSTAIAQSADIQRNVNTGSPLSFELIGRTINSAMDEWCWNRLVYLLDEITRFGKNPDIMSGIELHESLRPLIQRQWEQMKSSVSGPEVRTEFLHRMLSPGIEGNRRAAQLRLGPTSIEFVAKGVLFALILAVSFERDCIPCQQPHPLSVANIDFLGYFGHLLSVECIGERRLASALKDSLSKEPRPLLLPHCHASHRELSSMITNWTRIGHDSTGMTSGQSQRLGQVGCDLFLIFTATEQLMDIVSNDGLVGLRGYMHSVINEIVNTAKTQAA